MKSPQQYEQYLQYHLDLAQSFWCYTVPKLGHPAVWAPHRCLATAAGGGESLGKRLRAVPSSEEVVTKDSDVDGLESH